MSAAPFLLRSSPAQVLEAVGSEFDPLLSATARARLLASASRLELPARTVCLECRLDGEDRVDLALCLAGQTAHLEAALARLGRNHASDRDWQRCVLLLERWASGEPTLAGVPFLFAAFDLASDLSALPVPCLSLCTDPSFFMRRMGLPVPRAPRTWPLQLLDVCCAGLGIDSLTPAHRERARACLAPVADTEVRQLSLMLAREPAMLKFDLTVPTVDLSHFLQANAWLGDIVELSEQLRFFAPWQQRVQLNYCVIASPEPQPELEVELCGTGPDECGVEQRAALLDRLVSSGLARADKARALLELLHHPTVVGPDGLWVARNWYLKLRFDGARPSAAKAYIGLTQRSVPV